MRKIFTVDEYRAFQLQLKKEIGKRELSITAAASILGITRQSLHNHLRPDGAHQPRWRFIRRAVRVWDLVIVVQGQRFDRQAFGSEPVPSELAVQLPLPEFLERVQNANLEVTVSRKTPSSLVLEVLVRFAS